MKQFYIQHFNRNGLCWLQLNINWQGRIEITGQSSFLLVIPVDASRLWSTPTPPSPLACPRCSPTHSNWRQLRPSVGHSTAGWFLQTQISWLTESHKVCWNSFYLALWRTSNFGFILHFLQYLGTLKLAMGRYFHVHLERQREKTSHSVLKRFCLVLEESLRNIWRQHLPVLSKPSNLLQLPTPVNKLLIYFSHRSD